MADIPNNITFVLPRVTSRLDSLRETIVEFLNKHNVSEGCVSRIELSIYEAVVNIIEHSSPQYHDKEIHVECTVRDNEVLITISHFGDRFDITKAELPDIEKHYKSGKMRGLGIYFIMTLMDKVEYSHNDMISTLKMSKNI
jgi:anti-sigma regulatory factor (Ser/Thr protein kinase)